MITSEMVKTYAKQHGADLVGIASIERFKDAPPETNPLNIYPETKSVIVLACRILEGSYKGIEQGTDWSTYWIYGYGAGIYSALTNSTNKLQSYIESFGYEAVISPGSATLLETPPKQQPVAKGKMPPNVVLHMRISAALAGLGELGWSKVFLTPEFGPRQRFEVILTDAELEQDPLMQENICDKCMQCVRHCPGHAISYDEEVSITVEGRKFSWGNIHPGKCKVTHWGINPEASPFIQKDLAGLNMDVTKTDLSWYNAFMLGFSISERVEYIKRVANGFSEIGQPGRPGSICGAVGCIQACYKHLKKRNKVKY